MRSFDTPRHVRGESLFIDDLPSPSGLLYAAVFVSPVPAGWVTGLDGSRAAASPGVSAVFTASDIPGVNQIGGIVEDEPLLAEKEVCYAGEPLALVVAGTAREAREAAAEVAATFEERPAVLDPREAAERGALVAPPRTIACGDVDQGFATCDVVVEGTASTGAQEHLYLETQGTMAIPTERGGVKLLSATQSPSAVQRLVARVLGLPMNRVEVETARLGGAFGGKEDQATPWAALAALAAWKLRRPVKLVLTRGEDLAWTGKRHPYEFDYKIGLARDGRVIAYEATFYQNSGAVADLSPAVLERSLLHATSAYFVPNVRVTGLACRTNLPPFTAFRGFGAPQATFCIEAALDHGARALGMPRRAVQSANLLRSGDALPFGMMVENARAVRSFEAAAEAYELDRVEREVAAFNREHLFEKQGVSVMPVCFGISFTTTFLNQAGALVHIYTDGTVALSTGAVEMGQGVNTKLVAIAAAALGIPRDLVSVEDTNTSRVANTSPTAASSAADMNGMAVRLACRALRERLLRTAADVLGDRERELSISDGIVVGSDGAGTLSWKALVAEAYTRRISLSSQAHFATPGISYDKQLEAGRPFAYHVFGTAITRVTLDALRGEHRVDEVRVIHDAGRSLDEIIDIGQVEGGIVQGIGWMTMEEVLYRGGRLLTSTLSTYKVPDLPSAPRIEVRFLKDADNPAAVMGSKAVGEPPFLYGIGTFFALLDAMRAHAPDKVFSYDAPLTNERVLTALGPGE